MARRTFSKLRRTALTLTLLLASQLSLAGQISDMVGVSATEHASLAEQAHSWVSPERLSISDEGCRVACQSKEFICIPRGGATISAVLPGESPTLSPALTSDSSHRHGAPSLHGSLLPISELAGRRLTRSAALRRLRLNGVKAR
jgi:hypothetical protein